MSLHMDYSSLAPVTPLPTTTNELLIIIGLILSIQRPALYLTLSGHPFSDSQAQVSAIFDASHSISFFACPSAPSPSP